MCAARASRVAPRRLPEQPNLEQLRKQAKDLLKNYRSGDAAAIAEVERFERNPRREGFTLTDAQRVLARAYGFQSWPKLKAFVDGVTIERFAEGQDPYSGRKGLADRGHERTLNIHGNSLCSHWNTSNPGTGIEYSK